MKRLYLLRHGQTEFNVKKLVQGRCDSPLTDLGRKQAGMAAAWIKAHDVVPDKVVSSPLGRAMDTAQLVATELLGPDAAVEPCEGIIERSYGTFEEGPHDALPTDVWDPGEEFCNRACLNERIFFKRSAILNDINIDSGFLHGYNMYITIRHNLADFSHLVLITGRKNNFRHNLNSPPLKPA